MPCARYLMLRPRGSVRSRALSDVGDRHSAGSGSLCRRARGGQNRPFLFFLLQQKSLNRTLSQLVGWAARLAARVKPLTMSCLFPIIINLSVKINDNFTKYSTSFYLCDKSLHRFELEETKKREKFRL